MNPRLVVYDREVTVGGEHDNRVSANGTRAVMGFPLKPAAALTGRSGRDEHSERGLRVGVIGSPPALTRSGCPPRQRHDLASRSQPSHRRSRVLRLFRRRPLVAAGVPVSVASSTCYTQDLAFEQAGTCGRDAAQAFSLVHVYPETVMHSVVPVESGPTAGEAVTAQQAQQRLERAGIVIPDARQVPRQLDRAVSGPGGRQ